MIIETSRWHYYRFINLDAQYIYLRSCSGTPPEYYQ